MRNGQPGISANRPVDAAVSVLVPVYNEEQSLPDFLARLRGVLNGWNRRAEVVFVDDASGDRSALLLAAFCSEVPAARLVRHAVNRGRGNAVLTAVDTADGEILVTIDADLENPPEAIPLLVDAMRPGVSCVTGYRKGRSRGDARGMASWLYNRAMAVLTGLPLHDCNCGLKAFRRTVLERTDIRDWLVRDGDYFRFFVYLLSRLGYRTDEYAFPFNSRRYGASRYRWKRYAKAGMDWVRLLRSDFLNGMPKRPRVKE